MIYERRHTRLIEEFGGLWQVMPAFSVVFLIVSLSSLGLPGLNGFVGEFLILVGAFQVHRPTAMLATTGVVFAAVYMLWMYQRVFMGTIRREENRLLTDLDWRETAILLPIVVLCLWMGVYSGTFLRKMDPSVQKVVDRIEEARKQITPTYRVHRGN